MTLRVTLVAALLALVALALLATGVAATAALRGYLLDQKDAQLRVSAPEIARRVENGFPIPRRLGRGRFEPPSAFYIQLTNPDGTRAGELLPFGDRSARPALPRLDTFSAARRARHTGAPFTVSSGDGGAGWRAVTVPVTRGGGSVTIALSLADVDATVSRLALIDLVVSLVVLALLAVLGNLAVRSSLRPLAEVETTAAAIAAGELSRRVPERDHRTEVGRLGRALNGMLAQIESAFRARSASEAAARASEERMRRFVADASHELRTPLTSIRGFAELYRQGAATSAADVSRIMRRVETEAERMGLLVDDLLLLARLDQQRPLERHPVDLLALAADAVHDARVVGGNRDIELRVLDGEAAPVVLGDEARLRQVIANLVSNALVHSPAGTPVTVTVGVGTDTDGGTGGGYALLSVADSGPGMRAEDAARVFERFYRADDSRTRAQGGSGLGLSIVAALVAAHGGTADLDTAPGKGATFRVRLPLAPETPPVPGTPPTPETPSQA